MSDDSHLVKYQCGIFDEDRVCQLGLLRQFDDLDSQVSQGLVEASCCCRARFKSSACLSMWVSSQSCMADEMARVMAFMMWALSVNDEVACYANYRALTQASASSISICCKP